MTVLYESPFWVGLFERTEQNTYQAARFVFGAEPTEPQLLKFALTDFLSLQFSQPVEAASTQAREVSFKRRMREVKKQMAAPAGATRAQQVIKQEYAQQAREREAGHREERAKDQERRYQLRQVKRAEKHRGH